MDNYSNKFYIYIYIYQNSIILFYYEIFISYYYLKFLLFDGFNILFK